VDVLAADRDRLKNEQHPAGEIGIRVQVPADLLPEIVQSNRLAKDVFRTRSWSIQHSGDLLYRRPRVLGQITFEHDDEVVIALARDLVPAPRAS
jgi:hypothetical protein